MADPAKCSGCGGSGVRWYDDNAGGNCSRDTCHECKGTGKCPPSASPVDWHHIPDRCVAELNTIVSDFIDHDEIHTALAEAYDVGRREGQRMGQPFPEPLLRLAQTARRIVELRARDGFVAAGVMLAAHNRMKEALDAWDAYQPTGGAKISEGGTHMRAAGEKPDPVDHESGMAGNRPTAPGEGQPPEGNGPLADREHQMSAAHLTANPKDASPDAVDELWAAAMALRIRLKATIDAGKVVGYVAEGTISPRAVERIDAAFRGVPRPIPRRAGVPASAHRPEYMDRAKKFCEEWTDPSDEDEEREVVCEVESMMARAYADGWDAMKLRLADAKDDGIAGLRALVGSMEAGVDMLRRARRAGIEDVIRRIQAGEGPEDCLVTGGQADEFCAWLRSLPTEDPVESESEEQKK